MEKEVCEKITEQATERINEILDQGINAENVEMLGELVDIQKDLEKIWKFILPYTKSDKGTSRIGFASK